MAAGRDSSAGADPALRLVVGLGNPGPRYAGTRHNAGFAVLDRCAAARGLRWQTEKKWPADLAKSPDGRLLLAKPLTFMNLSGEAAARIAAYFKIPPAALLVVLDDVDLPLGRLRLRGSGSAGGHNGMKSLIEHLGTDGFARLKIGVGRTGEGNSPRHEMIDHVLGRFDPAEAETVEKSLARATDAVDCALSHGLAAAMNRYNQNPEAPARPKPARRTAPPETDTSPPPGAAEPNPTS